MVSMSNVNRARELEYITGEMKNDEALRAYTASLLRNGLLREGLRASTDTVTVVSADKLGRPLWGARAQKFRHVGSVMAIEIVCDLLRREGRTGVRQWFGAEEDKLSGVVAHRCLLFMLGVTCATPCHIMRSTRTSATSASVCSSFLRGGQSWERG